MSTNPKGTAALTIPARHGIAKIRFTLSGDPEEMIVSFGIHVLETPVGLTDPAVEVNTLAERISNAWTAANAPDAMVSDYSYQGVSVSVWPATQTAGGPLVDPLIGEHNLFNQGHATGQPPPSNCAVLVKKLTASGGRPNRGRMFLPPIFLAKTAVNSRGEIGASDVGGMQGGMTTFLGNLDDATEANTRMVILHGMRGTKENPTPAGQPTEVTSMRVEAKLATQRRRMR